MQSATSESTYGKVTVQYAQNHERAVMLYSWWHSPKSGRKFAVIEKVTKGVGDKMKTVGIRLLEEDDSNPFYRDLEEWFRLVDRGILVEYVHNALESKKDIS